MHSVSGNSKGNPRQTCFLVPAFQSCWFLIVQRLLGTTAGSDGLRASWRWCALFSVHSVVGGLHQMMLLANFAFARWQIVLAWNAFCRGWIVRRWREFYGNFPAVLCRWWWRRGRGSLLICPGLNWNATPESPEIGKDLSSHFVRQVPFITWRTVATIGSTLRVGVIVVQVAPFHILVPFVFSRTVRAETAFGGQLAQVSASGVNVR